MEIAWALLKPKCVTKNQKKVILCSFYSPPKSRKQKQKLLIDHIIGTLQTLQCNNPDVGIMCVGGDKNQLDISDILRSDQDQDQDQDISVIAVIRNSVRSIPY